MHEIVLHLLELLQQRDVAQHGGRADGLAVRRDHRHHRGLSRAPVRERQLHGARGWRLEEPAQVFVLDGLSEQPAQQGLRHEPEHRAHSGIGQQHDAVEIDHEDGVGGAAEDGGQRAALVGQRLVRA